MQSQPLVSIVIVTRDRKAQLNKCLQSISLQNYKEVEILVIDNKSVDGTVEMIEAEFPKVNLIRLDRNLGCPGARNVGALNAHGEIIFFLDDDCIIDADAIDNTVPYFLSDNRLAVVTPQIIEPEINRTLLNMGNSVRYSHDFTGVSAIRRNVFQSFGLYPASFLYGAEETDLALRILSGDGHILYAPQVKVFHYPAKNRNKNWEMEQRLLNAIHVLLKYAPLARLLAGMLVKPLTFLPVAIRNHSIWGWVKAIVSIPMLTIAVFVYGQRTPLGWKPFLVSEYLMSNSIMSLDDLDRIDEKRLTTSIIRSRRFLGKRFRESVRPHTKKC
jgi:GT2 family glycosyltransferase